MSETIGVVVIGRNEGERLLGCLRSLGPLAQRTVYVESGSTDGSPDAARALGAAVVPLDMSKPFTAARARNAGFEELARLFPEVALVQFVDGDCELAPAWVETAAGFLRERPDVAIVCGRRRERFPERSVYNRMCDEEWDGPKGEILECGGDIVMHAEAFRAVGGYAPDLIAGEEPEMCVRLRAAGWRIWRLDAEMTLHDANITRFSQWWRRAMRAGHAFAEVSERHKASAYGIWRPHVRRVLVWAGVLPAAIIVGGLIWPPLFALTLLYPAQILRMGLRDASRGANRWSYSGFAMISKFAEMQGVAKYWLNRMMRRRAGLIEYK